MDKKLKLEKTRVYISEISKDTSVADVYPSERADEIANTSNEKARAEKYFAWRLLEHAISDCFGVKIDEIVFSKKENGRWCADGFDFSLSHSDGVCAVAISDSSVGVDIQRISAPRSNSFAKRILSEAEFEELYDLTEDSREEYLILKWCEKEAIFKSRNLAVFIPKETAIDSNCKIKTEFLTIGEKRYVLSVCASLDYKNVEFHFLKKGIADK